MYKVNCSLKKTSSTHSLYNKLFKCFNKFLLQFFNLTKNKLYINNTKPCQCFYICNYNLSKYYVMK